MDQDDAVKTTESGGASGYDAGKKIKGRKRHIITDTAGNLLHGAIHSADIQDRDGAPAIIGAACGSFPTPECIFAKPAPDLIRGRLCGKQAGTGHAEHGWTQYRNRQKAGQGARLCGHRKTLGGRAHLRMAGPLPKAGEGLGNLNPVVRRMAAHCRHQAANPQCRKASKINDLILSQTLRERSAYQKCLEDHGWLPGKK